MTVLRMIKTVIVIPAIKTDPKPKTMNKKLGTITINSTTRRTRNQKSGSSNLVTD